LANGRLAAIDVSENYHTSSYVLKALARERVIR